MNVPIKFKRLEIFYDIALLLVHIFIALCYLYSLINIP